MAAVRLIQLYRKGYIFMLTDIIGGIFMPHVVAFFIIVRIAMWEVHANGVTFREDMRLLWAWVLPHWRKMITHPLYWAAAGIVTAYFLVGVFL